MDCFYLLVFSFHTANISTFELKTNRGVSEVKIVVYNNEALLGESHVYLSELPTDHKAERGKLGGGRVGPNLPDIWTIEL